MSSKSTVLAGKKKPYSVKYLAQESCNAEQFLKDTTYQIDLEKLYKMHSSCVYSESMEYQPVQLEIHQNLQSYYEGNKYLIQVWDKTGRKAFETQVQTAVKQWAISYNYFIFKTQPGDVMDQFFQIVDLNNGNYLEQSTLFVEDYVKDASYDKITFLNGLLYVANVDYVKIVNIDYNLKAGEKGKRNIDPSQVVTINLTELNIHALGVIPQSLEDNFIHVWIEMPDSQVSIHQLFVEGVPGHKVTKNEHVPDSHRTKNTSIQSSNASSFAYVFKEVRERVTDELSGDKVKKLRFAYVGNISHAVALRQSGKVDVYYLGIRRDHPEEKFKDVELSFDQVYVKQRDTAKNEDYVISINTFYKSKMSVRNGKKVENFKLDSIFQEMIKNSCKLIAGYNLVETTLFVAHGKIITLFTLDGLDFVIAKHFTFDDEIHTIFRIATGLPTGHMIGIVFDNAKVAVLQSPTPKRTPTWNIKEELSRTLRGDHLVAMNRDFKQFNFPMFMTRDSALRESDETRIYICTMHKGWIYDLTQKLLDMGHPPLKKHHRMIGLYETSDSTSFVLHQDNKLTVYDIIYEESLNDVHFNKIKEFVIPNEAASQEFYAGIIDEEHLSVINKTSVYKFEIKTKHHKASIIIPDVCWQGMYVTADLKYGYTLNHRSNTHGLTSGLKYYDMQYFRKQEDGTTYVDKSYHLNTAQVGIQAFIDYSFTSQRLTYMQSFQQLTIIPTLHRNTIVLMGQKGFHKYLSSKVINDKYHALTNMNDLQTWNIATGKKIGKDFNTKAGKQELDFTGWSVWNCDESPNLYRFGISPFTLIRNTNSPEGLMTDEQFFDQNLIDPCFQHQQPFNIRTPKQYCQAKVIEILDDAQVKVHFSFIHPYYMGQTQQIFFNSSLTVMVERLTDNRVIMYERRDIPACPGEVKWVFVKRFKDFPQRIGSGNTLDVMCPDFSKYIDIEFENMSFQIKDSKTEEVLYQIPPYLMNFKGKMRNSRGQEIDKQPRFAFNRFKWVGSSKFRCCSDDGIEKMVEISNGKFKQVEYRCLQNFNLEDSMDNHLFFNKKPIAFDNTLQRLRAKAANYRAAQIFQDDENEALGRETTEEEFKLQYYESLITVDFFASIKQKRYIVDLSFSYLHWKLIEELNKGTIKVDEIDDETICNITHNVLPQGESYLTKLFQKQEVLEAFYKRAMHKKVKKNQEILKYKIPMYNNFEGDNCFSLSADVGDMKTLNMHLDYLKHYQLDHHSRMLYPYLAQCIEAQLPALPEYIESRQKSTLQTKKITKGEIHSLKQLPTNGVVSAQNWQAQDKFLDLYKNSPTEVEVQVNYIDTPVVYNLGDPVCQEYFAALGQTEQMEIFDQLVIQKQIEYNWPITLNAIIKTQLYPFLVQFISYWVYSQYFIDLQSGDQGYIYNLVLRCINLVLSTYFIFSAIKIAIKDGYSYFLSPWAYLDFGSPVLIVVEAVLNFFGYFDGSVDRTNTLAIIQAGTTLLLWLKFLYFMRVFKSVGFYIKTIIEVMIDMRYFLVVLLVGFLAFGDSLRKLQDYDTDDNDGSFIDNVLFYQGDARMFDGFMYIFAQALGNYDPTTGSIGASFTLFLIFLSAFFNCIIMMNLLIAIISDSFARVNSKSVQAAFREQAALIAENQFLISGKLLEAHSNHDEYLLFIRAMTELAPSGDDDDEDGEKIKDIKDITSETRHNIESLREELDEFKKQVEAALANK